MVAGPEVSHLVSQYEAVSEAKDRMECDRHHEQTESANRVFLENVEKLYKVIKDMDNPFQEDTEDLVTLDTKIISHPSVAAMVATHYEKGKHCLQEFKRGLENEDGTTFYEPIKKNKMDFFQQHQLSGDPTKHKVLKEDCHLFSKLFISCQSRECDLQQFFRHENQPFPAALSDSGKLHTCQKSQLATILETKVLPETEPEADVIIIDGSALINSLPPRSSKTFKEYATLDVLPTVLAYSSRYRRADIIFDVYIPSSLKAETTHLAETVE